MLNTPLKELSAALAQKKISSAEVTKLFLDRISRLNAAFNAFITVDAEKSLAPGIRAGRLIGRVSRRARRAHGARGDRDRHRRLDPPACGALGPFGPEADVRLGVPLRHDRLRFQPRPGWADGQKRRRPCAALERA